MAIKKYKQDPADRLDYGWDWQTGQTPFLGTAETISTSTWAAYDANWVTTADLTLDDDAHSDTTTVVFVKSASADTLGDYFVTNHIVTDQGREKDESFQLTLEEQ